MRAESRSEFITDASPTLMRYAQNDLRALLKSSVYEGKNVPQGDGHHVVLVPGLSESDRDLVFLRNFLSTIGYIPESSGMGINFGYPWQQTKLAAQVRNLEKENGRIYLIGHSLGGFMGAVLSQNDPNIERVVALGSPFMNSIDDKKTNFIESIHSPADSVVPNYMSLLKGADTRNVMVENPNHFGLLCHIGTFREIANALVA